MEGVEESEERYWRVVREVVGGNPAVAANGGGGMHG